MAGARTTRYEEIRIGDSAEFSKTVTQEDVDRFAEISGDFNPLHVDEEFARAGLFGGRIAHGFLAGSLISTVLGTILPGANTIYLRQEMDFKAPARPGDTLTAVCTVVEKKDAKKIITFGTVVRNQEGKVLIDGKAVVLKYEK